MILINLKTLHQTLSLPVCISWTARFRFSWVPPLCVSIVSHLWLYWNDLFVSRSWAISILRLGLLSFTQTPDIEHCTWVMVDAGIYWADAPVNSHPLATGVYFVTRFLNMDQSFLSYFSYFCTQWFIHSQSNTYSVKKTPDLFSSLPILLIIRPFVFKVARQTSPHVYFSSNLYATETQESKLIFPLNLFLLYVSPISIIHTPTLPVT